MRIGLKIKNLQRKSIYYYNKRSKSLEPINLNKHDKENETL